MEIQYDNAGDMLYIGIRSRPNVEAEHAVPGIVLDYDKDNGVAGIEITDSSKIADLISLKSAGLGDRFAEAATMLKTDH